MSKNKFTVAIIGVGGRGGYAYGTLIAQLPERFEIVALCDINTDKLSYFSKKFNVAAQNLFTDEEVFFQKKRADVLIIATQDKDHIRHATKAFRLGYDILLEKPITDNRQEMQDLLALQKETGCKALVCHVLRYAPAFMKAAELLENGTIGRLVSINAIEQIGYFHQAQAYVRGYWRKAENSTPMILAKCSHDLDLLQFYANSACESLSSIGDLTYFTPENAPTDATERCLDCPHQNTCPFSAKTQYLDGWLKDRTDAYPYNVPCHAPITEEKMRAALQNSMYGKCVFRCDNDVVDHQVVNMEFEGGALVSFTMSAFNGWGGSRAIRVMGTKGMLVAKLGEDTIHYDNAAAGTTEEIPVIGSTGDNTLVGGHGGGDNGIMGTFSYLVTDEYDGINAATIETSCKNHMIVFAAEEAREKGCVVDVREYANRYGM